MKIIICCLVLLSLPCTATEFKSPKSQRLVDQLVRSINQKLSEIATLEMAAGVEPEEIKIDLSQQERFDSGRFGAILDARSLGRVISVTPKSPAYQVGLHSGDTILSVNGISVTLTNKKWQNQLQYAKDNTPIKLTIKRDDVELLLNGTFRAKYTPQWQLNSSKKLLLNGKLSANYIPQWQLSSKSSIQTDSPTGNDINIKPTENSAFGCGRVIVGKALRKQALDKFTGLSSVAVITDIDSNPIIRGKTRHRLPVGKHTLGVGTLYNDNASGTKFALTIEPNTNYYIAYVSKAKWQDKQGESVSKSAYTGPVVYKTKTVDCEL